MNSLFSSLYLHFPFCETKCHYCDFYSIPQHKVTPDMPTRFEKALKIEIIQNLSKIAPQIETLFLGGGTPSMTSCQSMVRALEPLWKHTQPTLDLEWTMEANPSSIDLEALRAYKNYGINRISLGVQSLDSHLLKRLGRVHSREAALKALENIFLAEFKNVSVDLLCGVPGQTLDHLEESIRLLTDFPITHFSCYILTLTPQHPMYSQLPDEATQLEHFLFVHQSLVKQGFEHYEISNFAKIGKKAKHNLNYWKHQSYLGLGPSAHSYDAFQKKRWKNYSSLHHYVQFLEKNQSVKEWEENLSPKQTELEKWILALRLNEGFPKEWLYTPLQKKRADLFQEKGLIEIHPHKPHYLRLTPQGFTLSDQIIQFLT